MDREMDREPTREGCSYDFSTENLQALWLEFQQTQAATCPETGAAIHAALLEDRPTVQPTVQPTVRVHCERCGRQGEFEPATLTGVQEVE